MDRHGRGVRLLERLLAAVVVGLAQVGDPIGRPLESGVLGGGGQRNQRALGVGDHADGRFLVVADLGGIGVDVDHLEVGRPARRQAGSDHEVEARAHDERHIGLAERLGARGDEAEVVILGDDAATLRRGVKGNARCFDELFELGRGVGPENAGTGQDDRPLSVGEQLDRFLDLVGIGARDASARQRRRGTRRYRRPTAGRACRRASRGMSDRALVPGTRDRRG